ncbi:MAG: PEP-CTERM sorting domain-containing protein [Planctomycetota bacterium]
MDFPNDPERLWARDGTNAASDSDAIVGLDYGTGVLNLQAGTDLNFGRTLAADERVFLIKDGVANSSEANPDRLTLLALAGDTLIGDFSINLDDNDYGATLSLGVTLRRESNPNNILQDRARVGVSFLISDLTGTTGDLSTLTGFRVSADGNEAGRYDLAAAGVVIPEPRAIALLGLGAACLLGRRRA